MTCRHARRHAYRDAAGPTPPELRLPGAEEVSHLGRQMDGAAHRGRFGPVALRRQAGDLTYEEHLDVLRTYSGHRALPTETRDGPLRCIAGLIDGRQGDG